MTKFGELQADKACQRSFFADLEYVGALQPRVSGRRATRLLQPTVQAMITAG